MRNLAEIVTVEKIEKLPGKDRIVLATFKENSYEAIVPVEIQEGQLVVWIGEGSILPEIETFEFLRARCYKESLKGFLIKPMVMGKKEDGSRVKSWGLVMQAHELGLSEDKLKPGMDLTETLKIRKYEPEEEHISDEKAVPPFIKFCFKHKILRFIAKIWKSKNSPVSFPSEYISKSDETTIQNYKGVLEKFASGPCYVSLKMEGQSFTTLIHPKTGKFMVCSRSQAYVKNNGNTFWKCAETYDIENKLKKHLRDTGKFLIIQGEQCGPGIQSNIYNFSDNCWFVYTLKEYDPKSGKTRQLTLKEMNTLCSKLELNTVPIIEEKEHLSSLFKTVEDAVLYAENKFWGYTDGVLNMTYEPKKKEKLWKDYLQHEGIVVRSTIYDKDENCGFSFKVKNIQYSEKNLTEIAEINRGLRDR